MRIDFLTLFPEIISTAMGESIIGRAQKDGKIEIGYYQIRDYSENKQKKVDDTPYGGGPGMLMTYQPIKSCYDEAVKNAGEKPYMIYMSPKGKVLNADIAKRLAQKPYIAILCGHYEGVDQRVIDGLCDEEISIGDYVLTGGELPAAVLCDTVSRFVPGVLGDSESPEAESFENLLLEYPQYTKPAEIEGMKVPEVLQGGNHKDIVAWRLSEAIKVTKERRPDLYGKFLESDFNAKKLVYLDNSATTRQTEAVSAEMMRIYREFYGNPSSLHSLGFQAEKEMRNAREKLAEGINADSSELIFTSGGSESNNLALKGYFKANKHAGKNIIISAVEHPSIAETAKALSFFGVTVSVAPVDSKGVVILSELEKLITPETAMISVMMVNSENGAIMPIADIARLKNRINPKIVFHVDAVQGYGKLPIDVKKLGIDMMSVSGHKIHGPRGSGFLYVKKGIRILPIINGGGQENGLRSGTENLAAICGLSKAFSDASESMTENLEKVGQLRRKLVSMLSEKYGDKVQFFSDDDATLPYILNLSFAPLRAEVVLHSLESQNVYVSVGSACSSHKKNRSPVLTAMGVPNNIIDGAVRISFSRFNTESDVEFAFNAICETVKELRKARRSHER